MNIQELQAQAYSQAVKSGWHNGPARSPGEMFCLMHSEISEALEEVRHGRPVTEIYFREDGKPEGVPIELADCVIRILDFCGAAGIDLQKALELKMKYNANRPWRHGGKTL